MSKILDSLGNQMGVLSVMAKEMAEIKTLCSCLTKQLNDDLNEPTGLWDIIDRGVPMPRLST